MRPFRSTQSAVRTTKPFRSILSAAQTMKPFHSTQSAARTTRLFRSTPKRMERQIGSSCISSRNACVDVTDREIGALAFSAS
ncbi:hypothetical protein DTO164E3_8995 [Paecilomyces variotii]|nr:hypothetical protein DTO164E3_8995 [Paecilomyces variotii]